MSQEMVMASKLNRWFSVVERRPAKNKNRKLLIIKNKPPYGDLQDYCTVGFYDGFYFYDVETFRIDCVRWRYLDLIINE